VAKTLQQLVQSVVAVDDLLPYTHVTDGYAFRGITKSDTLSPEKGSFFNNESLLYLFYGRPAYRKNSNEPSVSITSFAPICFLIRPDADLSPLRIFPFDSGAFLNGVFRDALHPSMRIEQFALEIDLTIVPKLIKYFFGSNRSYYDGVPIPQSLGGGALDFESESYQVLIQDRTANNRDERSSAVEIQVAHPVPLRGNLQAVVLPSRFAEDPDIKAKLLEWSIPPIPYQLGERFKPGEYVGLITHLVRQFLSDAGLL
jgi:hypothetical protein